MLAPYPDQMSLPLTWCGAYALAPTHFVLAGPLLTFGGPGMPGTVTAVALQLAAAAPMLPPAPFVLSPPPTYAPADHPAARAKSQSCCNRRNHFADCQCHRAPRRRA
eukprot:EG_transcript_58048